MALTKQDLLQIKELIDNSRDQTIGAILAYLTRNHPTKDELNASLAEVREEIKHLPNKEEFYTKMDEISGEYKTFQESEPLISHQLSDHEERLASLEIKTANFS